MSDRDRETWERFAAAALSGMWANPARSVSEQDACASAYEMLAMTKQWWPDEPSGNSPELPEKTCSPRCECVTQPAAGDETVTWEPVPAVAVIGPGSTQAERWLPGEIGAEKVVEGGGVEDLHTVAWLTWSYPRCYWRTVSPDEQVPDRVEVVDRAVAARLIAAARREVDEAKKECERLRLTEVELAALSFAAESADSQGWRGRALTLRGLRERHAKGGAA